MKQMKIWSMIMLAVMMMPLFVACGSDSDGEDGGARDNELKTQAIGLWMCIESRDTQYGQTMNGLMVGKEIFIYANNTYRSTSSSFGYTGTYTLSGNTITAKSSSGTFVVTVKINGDQMVWEGTASNGVTFRYVFKREIDEGSSTAITPPNQ